MLHSMTGFGAARATAAGIAVAVEVRSVNNRHLKLAVRGTDPYPLFEAEFEKVVRRTVRRGTVTLHVRVEREARAAGPLLDSARLAGYLAQIRVVAKPEELPGLLAGVLGLPGIAADAAPAGGLPDDEWPTVEAATAKAVKALDEVRLVEGQAMAAEFVALHDRMAAELDGVRDELPRVTAAYRDRLLDRVRQALGGANIAVESDHLIREVAIFADRTDVAEEVTRFAAHLVQFAEVVAKGSADSAGRRLEFVAQEMGREVNTMGSKAGDVAISRRVVEIKSALERVRELALNVE